MARPRTKKDLQNLGKQNYQKLMDYVNALPAAEQQSEFPKGTMNRNIRDVLAHLHHWHLMVKDWYETGMEGKEPDIPAKGYNWRQIPELNREIWKKYSGFELDKVKELLEASHIDMMAIVDKHDNDELFERGRYDWTGKNAVGSYLVSCTSSHYDWGLKLIRRAIKGMKT